MADARLVALLPEDSLARIAPTEEALKAAFRMVFDQAMTRIRGCDPTVIDNDTGEIIAREFGLAFFEERLTRSQRQHRFYRGPVLKQISQQATGGWTPDAWHQAFKRTILGFEVVVVKVAGRSRPTTIRRLRSTTKLSVREMSDYLDEVIATAATDMGVVFDLDPREREAVRYRSSKRKAKAPAQEAIAA